jgi:hypothetical protein
VDDEEEDEVDDDDDDDCEELEDGETEDVDEAVVETGAGGFICDEGEEEGAGEDLGLLLLLLVLLDDVDDWDEAEEEEEDEDEDVLGVWRRGGLEEAGALDFVERVSSESSSISPSSFGVEAFDGVGAARVPSGFN